MFRLGCLLVLVILVGIPAVAAQYLPWWGTLLVIVAEAAVLIIGGPKLVGVLGKRFMLGLFMTKSKVLRDAGVHVHAVQLTTRPIKRASESQAQLEQTQTDAMIDDDEADDVDEDEDEDEEFEDDDEASLADHRFVLIDFTVTPRPAQSKMSHWEPAEMTLVPFDAQVNPHAEDDHKISANTHTIRLIEENGNETEDFDKVQGPARLRTVFAVPPTMSGRVKFRYYFEQFGDLILPT